MFWDCKCEKRSLVASKTKSLIQHDFQYGLWGGRLGNLKYRGVLLNWIRVGQGPTALALGADGVVWTFFLLSIISLFFFPFSGRRADVD